MKHKICMHHRGHGCLSDVNVAITGVVWCEDNGFEWFVDWQNGLYSDDPTVNIFPRYFRQLLTGSEKFDVVHNQITPAGWGTWVGGTFHVRRDVPTIVVMMRHHAEVIQRIGLLDTPFFTQLREEAHRLFEGHRVAGFHRRMTDHADHGGLMSDEEAFDKICIFLRNHSDFDRLFCITDNIASLAFFQQAFGDRLISTDSFKSPGRVALHRGAAEGYSKTKLADEVLRDAFLLSQTDFKLLRASNIVIFALLCSNKWDDFVFIDEGVHYHD